MQKEKNKKIFFLKKKIRKKSFLIRKHASINNYNASFNASKNFFKLFNITSKDIVGCYWPINNELDTRPLISILSLKKNKNCLTFYRKEKNAF